MSLVLTNTRQTKCYLLALTYFGSISVATRFILKQNIYNVISIYCQLMRIYKYLDTFLIYYHSSNYYNNQVDDPQLTTLFVAQYLAFMDTFSFIKEGNQFSLSNFAKIGMYSLHALLTHLHTAQNTDPHNVSTGPFAGPCMLLSSQRR